MTNRAAPANSSLGFDAYRELRRFSSLDGLRAVSVLMVITFHLPGEHLLFLQGQNGVTLFFVISGFLISSLLLREEAGKGRVRLAAFYVRRAFRILPLYVVALCAYGLLLLVAARWLTAIDPDGHRQSGFLYALPYYLTYLQEVPSVLRPGLPFQASWSLGFEEKYYLVWPVLAFVLVAGVRRRQYLAGVLIAVFVVVPALVPWGVFITSYAAILWGALLALLLHDRRTFGVVRRVANHRTVPVLVVALVIVAIVAPSIAHLGDLFPPVAALAIGALVLSPTSILARLLETPVLALIGRLSYAIYLFHQLCLHTAELVVPRGLGLTSDIGVSVVGLAITALLTYGLHLVVEKPLIRAGHRLSQRLGSGGSWALPTRRPA